MFSHYSCDQKKSSKLNNKNTNNLIKLVEKAEIHRRNVTGRRDSVYTHNNLSVISNTLFSE